jgi:hypothetical protein
VLNVLVLWNTWYMNHALGYLRASGMTIADENLARLWPLNSSHFNLVGRYSYAVPELITDGAFRPLTQDTSASEEIPTDEMPT